MEQRPLYIASCSFGKDSIATILLALEHNEPLDRAVFAEVMFDSERNISGEIPEHIEWVYSTAIPKLETMGVKVDVVRSDDYISRFFMIKGEKASPKYRGKRYGWVLPDKCQMKKMKLRAISRYYKGIRAKVVQYVGIATDEEKRLGSFDQINKISLLVKYGYTEEMAKNKCLEYGLLSPLYDLETRNGCWFCPNGSDVRFCRLYRKYPHLWAELEKLSKVSNLSSPVFKYSKTFEEYADKIKQQQLTLF
jgi:3'-phosphoadenosine 5'-phosphosulfate sulfotransferase (PAPS reductase)/FAD synthetase